MDSPESQVLSGQAESAVYFLATGIPKGVIFDPDTRERAGAVRREGELVLLDRDAYLLWLLLLVPRTVAEAQTEARKLEVDFTDQSLRALVDARLALPIRERTLQNLAARLRPIPLGAGIGNREGQERSFELGDSTMKPVLEVDPVVFALWAELDGCVSLEQAFNGAAAAVARSRNDVESGAVGLILGLMSQGLLYLDWIVDTVPATED
jgi:hypothetical protein